MLGGLPQGGTGDPVLGKKKKTSRNVRKKRGEPTPSPAEKAKSSLVVGTRQQKEGRGRGGHACPLI